MNPKKKQGTHRFKTAIYLKNKKRNKKRAMLQGASIATMSKMMQVPTADYHMIAKSDAIQMINRFEPILNKGIEECKLAYGKQYDRSIFEALLALEGCTEIRIINALTEQDEQTFIIMAVHENETPLYLSKNIIDKNGDAITVEALADMGNNCQGGVVEASAYSV
jgi:hypothetical protein